MCEGRTRFAAGVGLLLSLLVAGACSDGSGSDADQPDGAAAPGAWLDEETGLSWEEPPGAAQPGGGVSLSGAESYCEGLGEGWRVPTISELRSLVRGCPATEPGGACAADDPTCLDNPDCLAGCDGCAWQAGPGQDGCYWPTELSADACADGRDYWSASTDGDFAFHLAFDEARVSATLRSCDQYTVRCVKDE